MSRLARVVLPGYPHHVTQRGSRKQRTFFKDGDYRLFLGMLARRKRDVSVEVWAYCLMPNHVHYVVVPSSEHSLSKLFRTVHRDYARKINRREGWRGHLWQERFFSVPMDEAHLVSAVRYVELNPVRAGLCEHPADWPWSSVHAHISRRSDDVVTAGPMLERVTDWLRYLAENDSDESLAAIRRHTCTGRPIGSDSFIERIESITGRRMRRCKPGPAPADK